MTQSWAPDSGRGEARISWLLLEQYHLGELPVEQAEAVRRAIEADPETRACFEEIQKPVELPPLRLPRKDPTKSVLEPSPPTARNWVARVVFGPWSALAVAAALLVYVATRSDDEKGDFPGPRIRVKGGDVALQLVRERSGEVVMAPKSYVAGDRFKLRLTCPPGGPDRFTAVVLQGGEVFYPLPDPGPVACGNAISLPGAFSLTGATPAQICVTWSKQLPAAGTVAADAMRPVLASAVCAKLEPAR